MQRLTRLGFDVVSKHPAQSTASDFAGARLVVVSESTFSEDAAAALRGVRLPMVVMEPALFDELGMTGLAWGSQQGDLNAESTLRLEGGSVLTGGRPADAVDPVNAPSKFVWGRPAASALIGARPTSGPAGAAAIFGYESGAAMVTGTAPARLVGFFAGRATPLAFNQVGWELFDAAVNWASQERALLVVDQVTLAPSDEALRLRLEGLGYAVVIKRDSEVTANHANTCAVVVISESTRSSEVGNRLTTVAVPVVVMEPSLYDDMKMTGPRWQADYGDAPAENTLAIVSQHPLAAGLASGDNIVTTTPGKFVWGGTPGIEAIHVASLVGRRNQLGIFAYDVSRPMVGLVSPARRVGFFAGRDTPALLNASGWKLFDAAIRWGTQTEGVVIPIAECVITKPNGRFDAVFGYRNVSTTATLTIPVGRNNAFSGQVDRGQPPTFEPGLQRAVFMVRDLEQTVTWTLEGRSVLATPLLPPCEASCVASLNGAPESHPPDPGAFLSAAESRAVRDKFDWSQTPVLREKDRDGSALIYHAIVYLDGESQLNSLDALRIHYDTVPIFDEDLARLDPEGGFSNYRFDGQGQFVFALIPGAVFNSLREAAVDPIDPVTVFRAIQIRSIATPAARKPCGLRALASCVFEKDGKTFGVFGYESFETTEVVLPAGSSNGFHAGEGAVPEVFQPGRREHEFTVELLDLGLGFKRATWILNGSLASLLDNSAPCPAEVIANPPQVIAPHFVAVPPVGDPACSAATPAELEFPNSLLPPAARVDTCTSLHYDFLGKHGFNWRNVEPGAIDTAAEEAETLLAWEEEQEVSVVTQPLTGTAPSGVELQQKALLGKLIRKVVKKVVSVAKEAVDLVRVGLAQVARLFVGARDITIAVEPFSTDADMGLLPRDGVLEDPRLPFRLSRPWGPHGNDALSIPVRGIGVRSKVGPFLFRARTNEKGQAKIKVLNGATTSVCFEMSNHAVELVDGWFLPVEICSYKRPFSAAAQKIRDGDTGTATDPFTIAVYNTNMNIVAQMSDAWDYMAEVAGFESAQAEVIVGGVPDFIGALQAMGGGGKRAFAPCFNLSWGYDTTQFGFHLGALGGQQLGQSPFTDATTYARADLATARRLQTLLADAEGFLAQAVLDLQTGAPALAMQAADTRALTLAAQALHVPFLTAAERVELAAVDLRQAAQRVHQLREQGHPDADAALRTADQLALALKTRVDVASSRADDLYPGIVAARNAARALATAAASIDPGRVPTRDARNALDDAEQRAFHVREMRSSWLKTTTGLIVGGVGAALGTAVGLIAGNVFEIFAGVDILLPVDERSECHVNPSPPTTPIPPKTSLNGLCYRDGDMRGLPTGKLVKINDPSLRRSVASRGVPTHEYAHFVMCNLLDAFGPQSLSTAYGKASADGVLGQTAEKSHVVVNEAFADFLTAQIVGAVDYFNPIGSLPDRSMTMNRLLSGPSYCPVTAGLSCLEDNIGHPDANYSHDPRVFADEVGRVTTTLQDVFDGHPTQFVFPGDSPPALPGNANYWMSFGDGRVIQSSNPRTPGDGEVSRLPGVHIRDMIFKMLDRDASRIDEGNLYRGINALMVDARYNWCQRCEVFKIHSPINACDEGIVGTRPVALACIWDPCVAPNTPNVDTRACHPPCPSGQSFDPRSVSCKPVFVIP